LTPRGEVEVVRQEMRGVRRGSSWTLFWLAHRRGSGRWSEAPAAREAIRRATLLPPRKLPAWLNEAAAEAERELAAVETEDGGERIIRAFCGSGCRRIAMTNVDGSCLRRVEASERRSSLAGR
jgi:hypothetical protein